jgi:hypothetical protein
MQDSVLGGLEFLTNLTPLGASAICDLTLQSKVYIAFQHKIMTNRI